MDQEGSFVSPSIKSIFALATPCVSFSAKSKHRFDNKIDRFYQIFCQKYLDVLDVRARPHLILSL